MIIVWEKVLPVLISIIVIIGVAVLRETSKPLAGILATMPINVPLALWIVTSAEAGRQEAVTQFTDAMLIGIVPTVAFILVVWAGARAGWSLWALIGTGYGGWLLTLGAIMLVRRLVGG